jgi:hypothetical protein
MVCYTFFLKQKRCRGANTNLNHPVYIRSTNERGGTSRTITLRQVKGGPSKDFNHTSFRTLRSISTSKTHEKGNDRIQDKRRRSKLLDRFNSGPWLDQNCAKPAEIIRQQQGG